MGQQLNITVREEIIIADSLCDIDNRIAEIQKNLSANEKLTAVCKIVCCVIITNVS